MDMLIKAIILLFVLIIMYSLGSALVYLIRGRDKMVVKALTWRISLSIVLFILLFIAYGLGWITPHQI